MLIVVQPLPCGAGRRAKYHFGEAQWAWPPTLSGGYGTGEPIGQNEELRTSAGSLTTGNLRRANIPSLALALRKRCEHSCRLMDPAVVAEGQAGIEFLVVVH